MLVLYRFYLQFFVRFIFLLYFIFEFVDRMSLDGKCIVTRKRYADTPFSVSGLSSRRASGYSTSVEAHKAMCLLSMLHAVHTPALWLRRCVCVCVCMTFSLTGNRSTLQKNRIFLRLKNAFL